MSVGLGNWWLRGEREYAWLERTRVFLEYGTLGWGSDGAGACLADPQRHPPSSTTGGIYLTGESGFQASIHYQQGIDFNSLGGFFWQIVKINTYTDKPTFVGDVVRQLQLVKRDNLKNYD